MRGKGYLFLTVKVGDTSVVNVDDSSDQLAMTVFFHGLSLTTLTTFHTIQIPLRPVKAGIATFQYSVASSCILGWGLKGYVLEMFSQKEGLESVSLGTRMTRETSEELEPVLRRDCNYVHNATCPDDFANFCQMIQKSAI